MICIACGGENASAFRFCRSCGARLGHACLRCGFENPSESKFCGGCGARIEEVRSEDALGERRQLTVLFCDIVGSTELSRVLDPEDLAELVGEYQKICGEAVRAHEGHIAQYLGDGVVVYFGYPRSHEDEAQRAVRCGLEILDAIQVLRDSGRFPPETSLDVRLGAHTGRVVVGPVGAGDRKDRLALGATPNIAARIQADAEPGTLTVSDATWKIVEGYFIGASGTFLLILFGANEVIAGTMSIHMELERRLAEFKRTEATVVFQSGFTANAGTVSSILGKDDFIISDELNHASIIDGARLSRATIKVFPHRDADAARAIVRELPRERRRLIISDGVFSMDGDLGALPELCDVADEFGCIMMVDDAHASGVFGRNGRGTIDHFGLHGRVDIQVGTLSKAIGALGGYVAGSRALIDFLHHRARPFLFSTSHPPSVAASCLAAIDVLEGEPQLIERLWENTRFFKNGLQALGFNTGASESPITPVIVGDAVLAMKLSDALFENGVFAQGIGFPTVPRGKARVRTIVTATHTRDELQLALDAFENVGQSLGVI